MRSIRVLRVVEGLGSLAQFPKIETRALKIGPSGWEPGATLFVEMPTYRDRLQGSRRHWM